MNLQEFKKEFRHGHHSLQTVVKNNDGRVVAILTTLDKLKDCLEDEMDAEISINGFAVLDYGYLGEVYLTVEYDGDEGYDETFELSAVSVY